MQGRDGTIRRRWLRAVAACAGIAAAVGCATTPPAAPEARRAAWIAALHAVDVDAARDARGRIADPRFDHLPGLAHDVPVAVVPETLAVVARTRATDAAAAAGLDGLRALQAAGADVEAAEGGTASARYAALVAEAGAGNVGVPVLIPVEGAPVEEWPAAVLTPDIVVRLTPAFVAAPGSPLDERLAAAAAELGVTVVRHDTADPLQCVVRAPGTDPAGWLSKARDVAAAAFCDGLAHADLYLPPDTAQERVPEPSVEQPAMPRIAPADPLLDAQWHLRNTGQGGGTPGADARVTAAWDALLAMDGGAPPPVVAVIDPDGVQWRHPDLLPAALDASSSPWRTLGEFGWEFRSPEEIALPEAPGGPWHGTAAAGLVCAARGNGIGGSGVSPGSPLVPVRVGGFASRTAAAIRFAAGLLPARPARPADVLSLSFGFGARTPVPPVIGRAVEEALRAGRAGRGCVVVCSLSNERVDNFAPDGTTLAEIPGVISVGRATNQDRWGRSGYGGGMTLLGPSHAAKSGRRSEVKLVVQSATPVPAADLLGTLDITTTDLVGTAGRNAGLRQVPLDNPRITELADPDHTAIFGGTSAATPIVAGAAALLLRANRALTCDQVRDVLAATARRIDTTDDDGSPLDAARYAATRGAGTVDAASAVRLAQVTPPAGTVGVGPALFLVAPPPDTAEPVVPTETSEAAVPRQDRAGAGGCGGARGPLPSPRRLRRRRESAR